MAVNTGWGSFQNGRKCSGGGGYRHFDWSHADDLVAFSSFSCHAQRNNPFRGSGNADDLVGDDEGGPHIQGVVYD